MRLEFKLVVERNNESQEVTLGSSVLLNVIESLPGDEPSFAGVFAAASSHPAATVRLGVARKECLPADAVMELADDPCASVRRTVVSNACFQRFAMNPLILRMIASDSEVAAAIAENFGALQIVSANVVGEALLSHADTNVRVKLAECEGIRDRLGTQATAGH
jgi:hypothetical protein